MLSRNGKATAALIDDAADSGSVLESVPDAMVAVDRAGMIRFVNRRAEAMFGYDRGALVGRLIEVLVPESFRTVHQAQREGYAADPKVREMGTGTELTGRRRDGTEFPVDIGLAQFGTGDDVLVIAAVRDMTARYEAEEDRRQADRMAALVEFSGDAIIAGSLEGVISGWNPAAERLFGYLSQEVVGRSASLLSPPECRPEIGEVLAKIRAGESPVKVDGLAVRKNGEVFPVSLTVSVICDQGGATVGVSAIFHDITEQRGSFQAAQRMAAIAGERVADFETIQVRKDGTELPVSLTVAPIRDENGSVVGASTTSRDITQRKEAARNAQGLAVAEDLVKTVMTSANIGIALADTNGFFQSVNDAVCDLLGYDQGWFLSHRLTDLIHPDDLEQALRDLARFYALDDKNVATLRLLRAGGVTVWVRLVVVVVPTADDQPNLVMFQMQDITAEHDARDALAHQAIHDSLTGLHNRAWIREVLQDDLRAATRLGTSVGTLFVSLDQLKIVNDSLGHAAGDEVLVAVAGRIVAALRPRDRVGRFGGDDFVIVVQDVHDVTELESCAQRVATSISTDLEVRGHRIVPTASIGIAISNAASTPHTLFRDTDSALFRAKTAMHAEAMARLTIEDEIREAIKRQEFTTSRDWKAGAVLSHLAHQLLGALPAHCGSRRRSRGGT